MYKPISFGGVIYSFTLCHCHACTNLPNSEVIKVSYTDHIQNVKQKFQRTKMPNFASHSGFKIVSKVLSRVTRLLSPG
jgi:hypothetical protein